MSEVLLGIDTLKRLEDGVNLLSNAVKTTLGPKGKNVVIKSLDLPLITNDGVTIAKAIELTDPVQNLGAKLIKQACTRTNELAGDGTTTACILTQFLINQGIKNLTAGANPIQLNKGINYIAENIINELQNMSTPITNDLDIAKIANISCQDNDIGELIMKAYSSVGKNGVINITEGQQIKTSLDIINGTRLDRGLLSTYFSTDMERQICEFDMPKILLFEDKLDNFNMLLPYIEHCIQNTFPLVIIADDFSEDVLQALLINRLKANLKCLPIKAPAYGDMRKDILSDLAIIFDTKVLNRHLITDFTANRLGTAKKVISTKTDTTFLNTNTNDAVFIRIANLNKALKSTQDINTKYLQTRIEMLNGKVAQIKVGGLTELEMNEKKLRIEDAVSACKSAIEEGIVIGGGCALLKIKKKLKKLIDKLDGDFKTGATIMLQALEVPIRQIAKNCELDDGVIVEKVIKSNKSNYGFDASEQKYGDLKNIGVIDPAKVIRCSIQNAVSVSTTILTTNCIVL